MRVASSVGANGVRGQDGPRWSTPRNAPSDTSSWGSGNLFFGGNSTSFLTRALSTLAPDPVKAAPRDPIAPARPAPAKPVGKGRLTARDALAQGRTLSKLTLDPNGKAQHQNFKGYDAIEGKPDKKEYRCKKRPDDNTPRREKKGGGGGGPRKFIPWC